MLWAITVAIAAPLIPQSRLKIINGSKTMLTNNPTAFAQKLSLNYLHH